ncbi:MAG: hypothetical protein KJN66_00915 [Bacteroidia bacterium]|nr:hypothetical protein [Bacteroidia bacterium]
MQKLENALSYNYGAAIESETEKRQSFNSDKTQVIATIDFKTDFQSDYYDVNPFNNIVTIALVKEDEGSNPESVELKADGPGNTYELITSVLAPDFNLIEVPDCSHITFGDHIDELFDSEL